MQIILRDDDTSFFTPIPMLERLYGKVWEHNLPVCLSVIPAHNAANVVPSPPFWKGGPFIEPNVAPPYRGQAQEYQVSDNHELCQYLIQRAREGLVEICLHGYNHDWLEMTSTDRAVIQRKLDEGRRIFDKAFPGVDIRTFVTPYDKISDEALEMVLKAGYHTGVFTQNLPPSFPRYPADTRQKPFGESTLFVSEIPHPCGDWWGSQPIDRAGIWAQAVQSASEQTALVSINHYWTYYNEWAWADEVALERWDQAFETSILPHKAQVTTFAKAAQAG